VVDEQKELAERHAQNRGGGGAAMKGRGTAFREVLNAKRPIPAPSEKINCHWRNLKKPKKSEDRVVGGG